jgi:hypothetical protein
MSHILKMMGDADLASSLHDIAAVLRSTVAMPRAAEAIEEAARRLHQEQCPSIHEAERTVQ